MQMTTRGTLSSNQVGRMSLKDLGDLIYIVNLENNMKKVTTLEIPSKLKYFFLFKNFLKYVDPPFFGSFEVTRRSTPCWSPER